MSKKPNIVWVTLDSVRADHTSVGGYDRDTTPELSRIASRDVGTNFTQGIAHSTRTAVSVTSMLTGLYPSQHQMIGTEAGAPVPPEIETVPERLSSVGYYTLGISENGYAGPAKEFDGRYDDFITSSPQSLADFLTPELGRSFLKYITWLNQHGPGVTFDISAHGAQNSYFTLDITKRQLRRAASRDDPIFCYVHFNDPHHPYHPPKAYIDEFLDDNLDTEDALSTSYGMNEERLDWIANERSLTQTERAELFAMYDAVIKYTDSCVGELFEFVQSTLEDTIFVVTGDHGELFGEYGLFGHHMVMHDALVNVPLVVHGLEEISHHADNVTQHIDIMKTLLSVAGADTTEFQGIDLRTETRDFAISQDLRETVDDDSVPNYRKLVERNPEYDISSLPQSMVSAARTTDFKLVHTDEWTELYHLPNESTDVRSKYAETYERLYSHLIDWLESEGEPVELELEDADLDEHMKQHLQDMGYIT